MSALIRCPSCWRLVEHAGTFDGCTGLGRYERFCSAACVATWKRAAGLPTDEQLTLPLEELPA